MTNKEAIEELKELIEIDLHPCPPIYEEALNLAIKALEQSKEDEDGYRQGYESGYAQGYIDGSCGADYDERELI